MKPVFADTSYYVALLNRSDEYAAVAYERTDALVGTIVTTIVTVHGFSGINEGTG